MPHKPYALESACYAIDNIDTRTTTITFAREMLITNNWHNLPVFAEKDELLTECEKRKFITAASLSGNVIQSLNSLLKLSF